jgi:hypothetical protein
MFRSWISCHDGCWTVGGSAGAGDVAGVVRAGGEVRAGVEAGRASGSRGRALSGASVAPFPADTGGGDGGTSTAR